MPADNQHPDAETKKNVQRANKRFNWIKDNLWAEADVVIIAVAPTYFTLEGTSTSNSPAAPEKLAQTIEDITAMTGNKPILIQSIPRIWDYDGQISYIDNQDKVSEDEDEYMNRVYYLLQETDSRNSFEYLHIEDLFLDDSDAAHTQIAGIPVYYNVMHINSLYSASAGEYFTEQLRELIR
jgi:cellulose biosynthesis protein BcsQ